MTSPCPHCLRSVDLPSKLIGTEVFCPFCRGEFVAGEKPKPREVPKTPRPVMAQIVSECPELPIPSLRRHQAPSWPWIVCLLVWLPLLAIFAPWLLLVLVVLWWLIRSP